MDAEGAVLRFAIAGLAARLSARAENISSLTNLGEHMTLLFSTWERAVHREMEQRGMSGVAQQPSPKPESVPQTPSQAAGADRGGVSAPVITAPAPNPPKRQRKPRLGANGHAARAARINGPVPDMSWAQLAGEG